MRYPIIADILIVLFIILAAVLKSKKGFFHSAMGVVVIVLAIAIAIVGSAVLTPKVTEKIWPVIEERIEVKIDAEAVEVIKGLLDENAKKLDGFWQIISENLEYVGIDINSIKNSPDAEGTIDKAANDKGYMNRFKDNIKLQAEIIMSKIVNVVLGIIIFILAWIILGLIRMLIGSKMTEVPVIGGIDRFLGFILGLIEAFVLLFIVIRGANLFHIDFFKQYAEGTVLLNWFIGGTLEQSIALLRGFDLSNLNIKQLDFSQFMEAVKGLKK